MLLTTWISCIHWFNILINVTPLCAALQCWWQMISRYCVAFQRSVFTATLKGRVCNEDEIPFIRLYHQVITCHIIFLFSTLREKALKWISIKFVCGFLSLWNVVLMELTINAENNLSLILFATKIPFYLKL